MIIVSNILAAALSASAIDTSKLAVENCDAGEMYEFNKGECNLTLSNNGENPIRILDMRVVNEGDSVEHKELTIAPHAHAYLKMKFDVGNEIGSVHHALRFRTDERPNDERFASAAAFVTTILDESRPQVDFGVIRAGVSVSKSIELGSHDVAKLRVTKVLKAPAWLDASVAPDGHSVAIAIKQDADWGVQVDFVKVAIDAPQQSQAWIEVKADVVGNVVPSINPYDMGLMRIGSPHEFRIPLVNKTGKDVRIGKVELAGFTGSTQIDTCEKASESCRMLIVHVADQQPGQIKGHAWIELPDYGRKLRVAFWGLLVPADTKVKTIDPQKMLKDEEEAGAHSKSTKTVDLERAVEDAVNAGTQQAPPGKGPLLKWTIANSQAIHGFQIFRADAESGPFVLLNAKTIPSIAKTPDSIGYQYRDDSAQTGKTYWYYIGIVYNDGHKQALSGPQRAVSK